MVSKEPLDNVTDLDQRRRRTIGPPPDVRRPRRDVAVTYRVRIDLDDVQPPIWRRLELRSDLFLDEVHRVIQTAFGWADAHLHRFAVGPGAFDRSSTVFLCPYDVEEGDDEGLPADAVRLDEVLADVGDRLLYAYDYGDGWEHTIVLEAVLDGADDRPRVAAVAGRRSGPPENCGGPWGFTELLDSGELVEEPFDLAELQHLLAEEFAAAPAPPVDLATLPQPLAELAIRLAGRPVAARFAALLHEAQLDQPAQLPTDGAAAMVSRFRWLLDRVGDAGIKLTQAGYLPPADVSAAVTELGMDSVWIGKGNREVQTQPVLALREAAQRFGLLRKSKGMLLLTKVGRQLRDDPVALLAHCASRLLPTAATMEAPAGLVALVGVAAGRDLDSDGFGHLLRDVLATLGWVHSDGTPVEEWDGLRAAWPTLHALEDLGGLERGSLGHRRRMPTPAGVAMARACLRGGRPLPLTGRAGW